MKSISLFIILVYLYFPIGCLAESAQQDIQASSEMEMVYISEYTDKQGCGTVQSDGCFDEYTATDLLPIQFFPEILLHGFSVTVKLPHMAVPIFVPPQNWA